MTFKVSSCCSLSCWICMHVQEGNNCAWNNCSCPFHIEMLKWYDSICALDKVEQPRGGEPRIGVNVSYFCNSEVPVTETFLSEGNAL